MWIFCGAILGLFLGGITGGLGVGITGAILGAIVGWIISLIYAAGKASEDAAQPREVHPASSQFNQTQQIEFLQKALEDIHWRLQRLEQKEGFSGSPLQGGQAKSSANVQATAQYVSKPEATSPAAPATAGVSKRIPEDGLNTGVLEVSPSIASAAARLDALEAAPAIAVTAAVAANASSAATRETAVIAAEVAPPIQASAPVSVSASASPPLASASASAPAFGLEPLPAAAEWRAAPLPVTAASPVDARAQSASPSAAQPESASAVHSNLSKPQPHAPKDQPREQPRKQPRNQHQAPPEDSLFTRLLAGNIVAKIGVIVLFFGVSFLLKYAFDRATFPPWAPLLASVVAAIALFVSGGWCFKKAQDDDGKNRKLYGLILMGGASGLMYLNVFFAMKQFGLISPATAFVLFFMLCIGTIILAVKLDARVLAALAMFGGFLAPVLASTGSNNHQLLFSYYLLLNLFVLAVSWFKSWRELNLIGFVHTFIISTVWGMRADGGYTAEKFATTEPFLLAFFFIYLCVPVLFAFRQPPKLRGLVDGTLVFGTPLTVFMAQIALTSPLTAQQPNQILAYTAIGATLIYGVLTWVLRRVDDGDGKFRVLADAHLALAIVFLTLIPYYLFVDAKGVAPTFALWTVEAAAIFWIACRQNSQLARTFALLLHGGAACYFAVNWHPVPAAAPWLNATVVGCFLIAAGAWLLAYLIFKYSEVLKPYERLCEFLLLTWGALWLLAGVDTGTYAQLMAGVDGVKSVAAGAVGLVGTGGYRHILSRSAVLLTVVAGLVVLIEFVGSALSWEKLRKMQQWQLPFFCLVLMAQTLSTRLSFHPLMHWCAWAWPISLAVFFWAVQRQSRDDLCSPTRARANLGAAFGLLLLSWEGVWRFADAQYYWVMGMGLAATLLSSALFYITKADVSEAEAATPTNASTSAGKPKRVSNSVLADLGLVWGVTMWMIGGFGLFSLSANAGTQLQIISANLLFTTFTVAVLMSFGRILEWALMRRSYILLVAVQLLSMFSLLTVAEGHPLAPYFWLAWLASVVVLAAIAWLQSRDSSSEGWQTSQGLALYLAWFVLGSLLWEGDWNVDSRGLSITWELAMHGALLLVTMAGLKVYFGDRLNADEAPDTCASMFHTGLLLPVFILLFLGSLYSHFAANGSTPPLPYLPVFNAIDLVHLAWFGLCFMLKNALFSAVNRASSGSGEPDNMTSNGLFYAMVVNSFLWINAIAARTVHQYVGIPFEFNALFNSAALQTVMSLLWTATAWALMVAAGRLRKRSLWMLGGALLVLVVAKLFLHDLATIETIWRIVLFMGVGGLLLVIGYVSPIPPSEDMKEK